MYIDSYGFELETLSLVIIMKNYIFEYFYNFSDSAIYIRFLKFVVE